MIRDFIKYFEGVRLEAYADTAGVWTIGIGHTKGVKQGDKITPEQADAFLDEDIKEASKRIPATLYLEQYEWEAVVDICFNLSSKSSQKLIDYLVKDKELFKRKLLQYCKDSRGHFLKGLLKRRMAERFLFENRDWSSEMRKLEGKTLLELIEISKQLFGG